MKNFFISYHHHDRAHAEWIGWKREEAGYTIVMQAWHFKPSGNFVLGHACRFAGNGTHPAD